MWLINIERSNGLCQIWEKQYLDDNVISIVGKSDIPFLVASPTQQRNGQ